MPSTGHFTPVIPLDDDQALIWQRGATTVHLHQQRHNNGPFPALTWVARDGLGAVEAAIFTDESPGHRGSTFRGAVDKERRFTTLHALEAGSIAELEEWEYQLSVALAPSLGLGTLTVVKANGVVRSIDCLPANAPGWGTSEAQNWRRKFTVTWQAPDPYWYDPLARAVAFSGMGDGLTLPFNLPQYLPWGASTPAVGQPARIVVDGDAPTTPVLTLYGPMITPSAYNLTTGDLIAFDQNIPAGGVLVIDGTWGNASAQMTAAAGELPRDWRPAITDVGDFWELNPGTNYVLITNAAPGIGGVASLSYKNRYRAL